VNFFFQLNFFDGFDKLVISWNVSSL